MKIRINKADINSRVLMMITYTGVILTLLFVTILILQRRQASSIHRQAQTTYARDVNTFLAMQSNTMKQIVYDYTYWDEFAEGLEKGISNEWLQGNINTLLEAYDFCYVAVYNKEHQLIHEVSKDTLNIKNIVPTQAIIKLRSTKTGHYFVSANNTILEITSGSIQPVSHMGNAKNDPSGYLVLAQSWDGKFLNDLSRKFNSSYNFTRDTTSVVVKTYNQTVAPYYFYDWQGKQIGKIWFTRSNPLYQLYRESSVYMLIILLLSLVFLWFTLRYSIKIWVLKPLTIVANILRKESFADIASLKKAPVEFAQLAILLKRYIAQKEELKTEKEKAEQADLLKTQFIANMSHEIRTPMNSITGFAELLKDPDLSEKDKNLYIDIIQSNSDKMIGIINSLINISKLEAGQETINVSPVSFREISSTIREFFNNSVKEKGLELKCTSDCSSQEDFVIHTDREKLHAIFSNIIHNAIKYSSTGVIECSYIQKENFAEFTVKDQGIGIESQHIKQVFERFFQVESDLNRNYEGVGLGLSIAKAYTELLGGSIWAESLPGEGSAFHFTIPLN